MTNDEIIMRGKRAAMVGGLALLMMLGTELQGAGVTGGIRDAEFLGADPIMLFIPKNLPQGIGTNTYLAKTVRVQVRGGAFSNWLAGGLYKTEFQGEGFGPGFNILVPPNDTNVYTLNYVASLATNLAEFYYTNRFPGIASFVLPGTHMTAVTNNPGLASESLTLSSTGGGSGGAVDSVKGEIGDVVLTLGDMGAAPTTRTISTTAPLQGGGSLAADRTLSIPKATSLVDGYLAAADFATFNGKAAASHTHAESDVTGLVSDLAGKQAAGNYITALTGDATGSGAGSVAVTLASVGTAGTYRSVTTDAKGRVTAGTAPTTFSGYAISDTSANLAAALTDETGTGAAVFGTAPTIAGGSLTALGTLALRDTSAAFDLTVGATSASAVLTAGRALTLDVGNAAHTVAFGTSGGTLTLPTGTKTVPSTSDNLSVFGATTSAQLAGVLSDETGSGGGFVRATSPTITTPTIADLSNMTHTHQNAAGGGALI